MKGKWQFIAVISIAMLAGFIGSLIGNRYGVIRAKGFEVVDSSGKVRGSLALVDSNARLMIRDNKGIERASITIAGSTTELQLSDAAGTTSIDYP